MLSLFGKRKQKDAEQLITDVVNNTQNPVFNQEIKYDFVKKGEIIKIEVYQKSKIAQDFQIASLSIPVKDIDPENKEIIKYTLHKPEAISNDIINKFVDFGEISLSFDHQITFNE